MHESENMEKLSWYWPGSLLSDDQFSISKSAMKLVVGKKPSVVLSSYELQ